MNAVLLSKVVRLISQATRITDRYTSGHGNYSGSTYTRISPSVELELCHNGRDYFVVYVDQIEVGQIDRDITDKALYTRNQEIKNTLINSL